jgi:hypothetical protein
LTPLGRVNEIIAKDSGVSHEQVRKIETILEKAPEDLNNRVILKFLEEFEWYIEAFKNQRNKGTPY